MRAKTAYLVTEILKTVVQSGTGTGGLLPRPMAGKTGTVELPATPEFQGQEGNAAAWFVGYTPDLVGAVWLGYDQIDGAHFLPTTVNGSTHPTAIWREIVGAGLSGRPALAFPGPDGQVPQPPQRVAEPPKPPVKPEPVELPAIRNLLADFGNLPGSIKLTWQVESTKPLPETVVFVVFRGTAPDFPAGPASVVGEVPTPSFEDIPASPGTYFYRVVAKDPATGRTGPVSESVGVTILGDKKAPPDEKAPPVGEIPPVGEAPPVGESPPLDEAPPGGEAPLPPGTVPPPPTKP